MMWNVGEAEPTDLILGILEDSVRSNRQRVAVWILELREDAVRCRRR
jgi:hypothetical protein